MNWAAAKHIIDKAADFIFPRHCLCCGKTNPDGEYGYICDECRETLRLLTGARCTKCSEPIGPATLPNVNGCAKCIDRKFAFDKSLCLCAFDGAGREIVHALKYRTGVYVLGDISKIAAKISETETFLKDAILVPVPLHITRTMKRHYNQSELIAKAVVKKYPDANAKIAKLLRRTRRTSTQTSFDKQERAANIKGAFAATKKAGEISKEANIVIVDDVMTSGATLSECAKTLKRAGFKHVSAFAFARRL